MSGVDNYKGYTMGNITLQLRDASDARAGTSVLSDTLNLFEEAQAFMCNAAGTVKIQGPSRPGVTPTTASLICLAGVVYNVRVGRFYATGTTVADSALVVFRTPY